MKELNDTLANYFSGNATEEEIRYVENWKTGREKEFSVLKEAWEAAKALDYQEFNTNKAWDRFEQTIQQNEESQAFSTPNSNTRWWLAAAATVALLVASSLMFLWQGESQNDVVIAFAEQTSTEINLPDGSTVDLNKGSQLSYSKNFLENRKLTLNGEAYFSVSKDENHPFEISTSHGTITVLGTSFNVNEALNQTTVTVSSGRVEVANINDTVILNKEEAGIINKSDVYFSDFEPNELSWHTGKFQFKEAPLSKAIKLLNEHYQDRFRLQETGQSACLLTATIDNLPLEELLELLILSCNLEVEEAEGKYLFIEKGAP